MIYHSYPVAETIPDIGDCVFVSVQRLEGSKERGPSGSPAGLSTVWDRAVVALRAAAVEVRRPAAVEVRRPAAVEVRRPAELFVRLRALRDALILELRAPGPREVGRLVAPLRRDAGRSTVVVDNADLMDVDTLHDLLCAVSLPRARLLLRSRVHPGVQCWQDRALTPGQRWRWQELWPLIRPIFAPRESLVVNGLQVRRSLEVEHGSALRLIQLHNDAFFYNTRDYLDAAEWEATELQGRRAISSRGLYLVHMVMALSRYELGQRRLVRLGPLQQQALAEVCAGTERMHLALLFLLVSAVFAVRGDAVKAGRDLLAAVLESLSQCGARLDSLAMQQALVTFELLGATERRLEDAASRPVDAPARRRTAAGLLKRIQVQDEVGFRRAREQLRGVAAPAPTPRCAADSAPTPRSWEPTEQARVADATGAGYEPGPRSLLHRARSLEHRARARMLAGLTPDPDVLELSALVALLKDAGLTADARRLNRSLRQRRDGLDDRRLPHRPSGARPGVWLPSVVRAP